MERICSSARTMAVWGLKPFLPPPLLPSALDGPVPSAQNGSSARTCDLLGVKPDWRTPVFTVFGAEQGNRTLFPSTIFRSYTGIEYANVHTNVHTL